MTKIDNPLLEMGRTLSLVRHEPKYIVDLSDMLAAI